MSSATSSRIELCRGSTPFRWQKRDLARGPATSRALLEAFAERSLLLRALEHAARAGYFERELGDSRSVLEARAGERSSV